MVRLSGTGYAKNQGYAGGSAAAASLHHRQLWVRSPSWSCMVTGTIGTLAGLLGQSLSIWLTRPRTHSCTRTTITVTAINGRSVSLTTENAADAERLLQTALNATGVPPADGQDG